MNCHCSATIIDAIVVSPGRVLSAISSHSQQVKSRPAFFTSSRFIRFYPNAYKFFLYF